MVDTNLLIVTCVYGSLILLLTIAVCALIFWIKCLKKEITALRNYKRSEINSHDELTRRGYSIHDGGLRAVGDSYFNPPYTRNTPIDPPADYYDPQPGPSFINKKAQPKLSQNMNDRGTKDASNDFTNILNRPDAVFGGDLNTPKTPKNPYNQQQQQMQQPQLHQQQPYRNSNYNDNVMYGNNNHNNNNNNHEGKTYFNRGINY